MYSMVHDIHAKFINFRLLITIVLKFRKLKLYRAHLSQTQLKMLVISDAQYYVSVKLYRIAGSIHLFKITGKLTPEYVKLKRNTLWEVIQLDWKEFNMTLNGNKINAPTSVMILLRDKFKIRCSVR